MGSVVTDVLFNRLRYRLLIYIYRRPLYRGLSHLPLLRRWTVTMFRIHLTAVKVNREARRCDPTANGSRSESYCWIWRGDYASAFRQSRKYRSVPWWSKILPCVVSG